MRSPRFRPVRRRVAACVLPAVAGALLASCASAPRGGPGPRLFPAAPAEPRLQFLTSFSSSRDVVPERGRFAKLVFGDHAESDAVDKPYGVAITGDRLYVCDTKRNLVNIFDLAKGRFGYLGFEGPGRLSKPINVTTDEEGNKYVADAERGEVVVFDADDNYTDAFGGDALGRPVDVAVSEDLLYVCDAESCRVVVFDRATRAKRSSFGSCGSGPEEFARPTNLAIGPDGSVFVSDTINGRVRQCDPGGAPRRTFGGLGTGFGKFARPKGVAVDRAGRLYAVDAAFENVQIFDEEGRLLLFFGGPGNRPGDLNLPAQVVVDYAHVDRFRRYAADDFAIEYLVLVTSQYGPHRVSVYGFGRREGTP